jgi:Beta-lactamase class C and other penicillin binding proteins
MACRLLPLLLLFSLLGICPVEAQDTGPASPGALRDSIEAAVGSASTPGAGVVLFSADSIQWEGYFGLADHDSGQPVTDETVFRAGSISKSFVSTAALLMAEEKRLDLQAPVRDLAPEIEMQNPWAETDPVRVAHLLEHTAGFDDLHIHERVSRSPDITLQEGLAINPATRQARWRPGMYYSYSNAGPPVAAYIVEKKSGQPFDSFVIDRIFEPLGMTASSFLRDERAGGHLATGYAADGETEKSYVHIGLRPSGALNARPTDLARFGQMLLGRGTRGDTTLLDTTSVQRMETARTSLAARHGLAAGYGLGNSASVENGFVYRGHGGAIDGFVAEYGYLPEYNRGFVVMLNSQDGDAQEQILDLIRSYQTRSLTPPEPPSLSDVPADTLAQHAGYYVSFTPRNEITRFVEQLVGIVRVDTTAQGLSVNPVLSSTADTLLPIDAQRFRGSSDPVATAVLARNQSGRRVLSGNGNLHATSAVSVWGRWIVASLSVLFFLSPLLFILYWAPMKALGRLQTPESIHLRLWPLLRPLCCSGRLSCSAWASKTQLHASARLRSTPSATRGSPSRMAWRSSQASGHSCAAKRGHTGARGRTTLSSLARRHWCSPTSRPTASSAAGFGRSRSLDVAGSGCIRHPDRDPVTQNLL